MNSNILKQCSHLAYQSLLEEVQLTPKPGLVDAKDNGAHTDMSITLFKKSAQALAPFFHEYITTGYSYADYPPKDIFNRLRRVGLMAEKAMYQATNGINTHKGANFSFSLLLGATGIYLAKYPSQFPKFSEKSLEIMCDMIRQMTCHVLNEDMQCLTCKSTLTHGEKLYLDYGIKGVRGEAMAGFPSLREKAMPFLRREIVLLNDKEWIYLKALIYLMTFVEDGNLIYRGGISAWKTVKEDAKKLLCSSDDKSTFLNALQEYNQILIDRRLSPGGSADLLSLSLYALHLEAIS